MNIYPTKDGPYPVRIKYETVEIDSMCEDALRKSKLLPKAPEPIKVDLVLERYFGVRVDYADLGEGIMGCTIFDTKGAVTGFIISSKIEIDGTKSSERRARSTIAHEGGHGLLHPRLFMSDTTTVSMFEQSASTQSRILCRSSDIGPAKAKLYDGKWWEWQANRAIAGLLLPKKLVAACVAPLTDQNTITQNLPAKKRAEAEMLVSGTFDVNPIVARIRLDEMFPSDAQMTL